MSLLLFIFNSTSIAEGFVDLSPQDVVDRVLAESLEKYGIENDRIIKDEDLYNASQVFDWGMESTLNFESAEREPLGPFENEKDETLNASLTLGKVMRTGTETSVSYTRESTRSELNSFLAQANQLNSRTIDFLTFEVTQPLLNNFWGGVDHRRELVQIALAGNHDDQKLEDLEQLLAESLELYWTTFSTSKALAASLASRDRYKKLVKVVERKKVLGFALPGELYQAKAEFEAQDRQVKRGSRDYLIALDNLLRRLQIQDKLEVRFDLIEEIPPFPKLDPVNLETLRPIKMANQDIYASELNKKAVDSSSIPELNLTGRLAYRGADENVSEAASDLGSFNSPVYYVGLEFRTRLGSESQDGAQQIARVRLANSKLRRQQTLQQIKDQIKASELTAKNAYQNAQSSTQVVEYRKKALKQIERAYRQGRRDLTEVINANTQLLSAETQLASDIGIYHTELGRLASIRDTLINQYTQPSKEAK